MRLNQPVPSILRSAQTFNDQEKCTGMNTIESKLMGLKNERRAKTSAWFFKTEKGGYGEGDKFLGIPVPEIRKTVRAHLRESSLEDAVRLLRSPWHEVRLAGCILMVELRKRAARDGDKEGEDAIYRAYLGNRKHVNNWDLVDVSARDIVGNHLIDRNREILYELAKSESLWDRRIAIMSTWAFIRNGESKDTFSICEMLMNDRSDLIHKACGWMLREIGKNCGMDVLNPFLDRHAKGMPRTMLRYALEKHNRPTREKYMNLSSRS